MGFAEHLVSLRRARGWSQEQLADYVGVSRQAVSKWESGRSTPDLDKLLALSSLFGIPLDALVRGEESAIAEAGPASDPGNGADVPQGERVVYVAVSYTHLSLFGWKATSEQSKFYIVLVVCLAATALIQLLFHSALGRSFMAIRDNEMTADSMGINSLLTKSIAFAISGALCGAAGALHASLSGYLSYQSFTYNQSTIYLIMIMIGGTISPVGAVIGTCVITILQEGFRALQDYMQLIYGVGVIVLRCV